MDRARRLAVSAVTRPPGERGSTPADAARALHVSFRPMRFASVLHDNTPLVVAIEGDRAVPLRGVSELGPGTPLSLLRDPPLEPDSAFPSTDLQRRPVVPQPRKVICVGLNYAAHIEETKREHSDYPVLFTKFATTLTGPYDPIPLPPESQAIAYEGEAV